MRTRALAAAVVAGLALIFALGYGLGRSHQTEICVDHVDEVYSDGFQAGVKAVCAPPFEPGEGLILEKRIRGYVPLVVEEW